MSERQSARFPGNPGCASAAFSWRACGTAALKPQACRALRVVGSVLFCSVLGTSYMLGEHCTTQSYILKNCFSNFEIRSLNCPERTQNRDSPASAFLSAGITASLELEETSEVVWSNHLSPEGTEAQGRK